MSKSSDTHTQARLTSGQIDDATLCNKIVENKDTDAFAVYMERHRAKFVHFLQHKFSIQSSDAEDCFQDAFIKLYRAMQTPDRRFCENPAYLKTWLHTCLIRECQAYLKQHIKSCLTNSFDSVTDQILLGGDGSNHGYYPDLPDASRPWGGHSQDPLICLEFTRTARKIETECYRGYKTIVCQEKNSWLL